MAIDPFSRRALTPDQWRAKAQKIQSELEGLTIHELLRGGVGAPKHDASAGLNRRGYDPNQRRVPAGHPDGGQWADEASKNAGRGINDPRVISDVTLDNLWIPGADYAANFEHHWYARHFYLKHPFSPEVKEFFKNATSGPLIQRLYSRRRQKWLGHGYGYDTPHRQYDDAVGELVTEYMRDRGIAAQQMTVPQAHEVIELIMKSPDPRIKNFVKMIQTLHRFFRRRGGRGNE